MKGLKHKITLDINAYEHWAVGANAGLVAYGLRKGVKNDDFGGSWRMGEFRGAPLIPPTQEGSSPRSHSRASGQPFLASAKA